MKIKVNEPHYGGFRLGKSYSWDLLKESNLLFIIKPKAKTELITDLDHELYRSINAYFYNQHRKVNVDKRISCKEKKCEVLVDKNLIDSIDWGYLEEIVSKYDHHLIRPLIKTKQKPQEQLEQVAEDSDKRISENISGN